jgi:hypothetical protein
MFENRVLREIFGSDREATGENCGKNTVIDIVGVFNPLTPNDL